MFFKFLLDHIIHRQVNSLFYLHIMSLMITSLLYSLLISSYILCVIGKTIRMIMIELRMFSYNFVYTIMNDILY